MDYPARADSAGMTPLELLLASVGGCTVGGLAVLLQRASQPFTSIEVEVAAGRRDEHPTILTAIDIDVRVGGAVDPVAAQKALSIAETQICPVLAMIKGETTIRTKLTLVDQRPQAATLI
jgi:putative redox protein